jgi:hypothetical protein
MALEFRLYPLTEVYAGWLFFPIERADEILYTWRWTRRASGSSARRRTRACAESRPTTTRRT